MYRSVKKLLRSAVLWTLSTDYRKMSIKLLRSAFFCGLGLPRWKSVHKTDDVQHFQLDCSPSLPTEPQLRLEAAKSTTGKLNVVVLHVVHVPHTITFVTSRDVARRPTT